MPFDTRAATDAYLSTLSPAAEIKAIHYTQGGHWLLLWGWVVTLVACVIIARSRLLANIEARVERRRARPLLASFLLPAVFMVADDVLELPWSVYAQWSRERFYGLTSQTLAGWFGEQSLNLAIGAVVSGLFFMALNALIRRAPRSWWLWAGGLAAAATVVMMLIAPLLIEPLFNRYTPAPPGATRDAVVALARVAGVPADRIYIYDGSRQSNRYTANVSGVFGAARVAMSDTMFARGADIAEVRGVVGHEMGHYKRLHALGNALFVALLALVTLGFAARTFPAIDRLVGSGARGIADPASLPTLVIIASTFGLAVTPMTNNVTRLMESDADAFSLRTAQEPDGLSKALVKTIEYRADSPSRVEEIIFYDHPSVRRRIERAMAWKASHASAVGRQEAADAAASR